MKTHVLKFYASLNLLFLCNLLSAQTVSIQVFNAASGITLDTVDVYINAIKIDNLPLGSFSPAMHVPSGNTTITVNAKNSTSISDQVLSSEVQNFTWSSGGGEGYHIFILGVETPSQYAPNPYGQNTGVHTWSFLKGKPGSVPQGKISLGVFTHFAPDLPTVHCQTRKDTLIGKDVPFDDFSDITINPLVSIGNQILDIKDSATIFNYHASFEMPLNLYAGKKILFPLITGFRNPAANKNGMPLSVFLVDWFDTIGGPALKLNRIPVPKGSFQFIHNSPTVSMDTIDVYVNGIKYNTDNLAFRKASAEISLDAGLYRININRKNSLDSGNLVIKRFTSPVTKNNSSIWMLAGVDSTSFYSNNPNGKDRSLQLLSFSVYRNMFSGINVNFVQGCTDAQGVKFQTRSYIPLATDLTLFGDTPSRTVNISILDNIADLTVAESVPPIRSFVPAGITAPNYQRRVVFTSGFLNPAANRNGAPLALVFIDSAGNSIATAPVSGVRFLHNVADTSMPSVDIWVDNDSLTKTKGLTFRKCSNPLPIPIGQHTLTVMKPGSTDPSDVSKQLYQTTFNFQAGKNYVMMLCGVKDTSYYASNPDSLSIGLKFTPIDNFAESALEPSTRFVNGVTDAKTMINPLVFPAALSPFGMYSPVMSTVPPPFFISFRSKDSSIMYAQLNYPNNSRSSLIFSSGFANTQGNPKSGAPIKFYVLASDNSVTEIPQVLLPKIQFLHLSPNVPELDIYVNKKLTITGLKRYNISEVIKVFPSTNHEIAYALKDSGYAKHFYTYTIYQPEGREVTYTTIGLLNSTQYKANPDGANTAFSKLYEYFDVTRTPASSGSCKICLTMSCTDLPAVDVWDPVNQIQISTSFGSYASYGSFRTINNGKSGTIKWLMANESDTLLLDKKIIQGQLKDRSGLTGIAFFAGFSDTAWQNSLGEKPQANQPLMLLIAWPDLKIDTLQLTRYTALDEVNKSTVDIDVYPIPASTTLSLKSKSPFLSVALYTITGQKVYEELFPEQFSCELSVADLKSGIYFLKIKGADQQEYFKKIVIE